MYNQKPSLGRKINWNHPLAKGLDGCWVFNEKSGDKVFDLSGQGNDGTITGADWVPNGLDFVETNSDYINCGQVISGYPFTLMALVKPSTISQEAILSVSAGNVATYHAILIDANKATARSYDGTIYDANSDIVVDELYSIVGVWTSASSRKLYINGEFATEDTGTESGIGYTTTKIGVSADSTPWGYFDGLMQYAYIYNRALSPSEIAELHRDPYAMFQQPVNPALLYGLPADSNWFLLPAQNKLQGMRGMNG